jgi:hypothetical protein
MIMSIADDRLPLLDHSMLAGGKLTFPLQSFVVMASLPLVSCFGSNCTCCQSGRLSGLSPDFRSRRGISRRPSALQSSGEFSRAVHNLRPIGTPGAFWRSRDDGVDLLGIQGALDHQRLGDG